MEGLSGKATFAAGSQLEGSYTEENGMTWTNVPMRGDGYEYSQEQGLAQDGEQYLKVVQAFDKYFYYAIDHMGAAPGSTVASC